jgi:predicted nucleic acid-binding protein
MTIYLLDTGPLGLLAHDRPAQRNPIQTWITGETSAGSRFFISEVADYEVRRELTRLVRSGRLPSSRLDRLDQLATICTYLPVSTTAWKRAAGFWADARLQGTPTASAATLDADALIAAQAVEISAIVVTNNPVHLGRWAPVRTWP